MKEGEKVRMLVLIRHDQLIIMKITFNHSVLLKTEQQKQMYLFDEHFMLPFIFY